LGKRLLAAVIALAARDVMEDDHSIAGSEPAHARAHRSHLSRRFMAKNSRRGVRSAGDFLQVRAAHAARMHAQKQFARSDLRYGNALQANIIDAAINRGQHVAWNFIRPIAYRKGFGDFHLILA
jgi:hypothetical protein